MGAFDHNGNAVVGHPAAELCLRRGPGAQVGSVGKDGRLYHYGNGTSQATAIAAGAVALFRAKFPNESARQIVQRVIATATDLGESGKDDTTGYGAVSLRRGMTANVPSSAPNPVYERLDKVLAAQKKDSGSGDQPAASEKKSSSNSLVFLVIGGLVALVVIVLVIVLISRGRRRPQQPVGRAPYPPGYDPYSQQGPPSSFGPPNHGPPPQGPPERR